MKPVTFNDFVKLVLAEFNGIRGRQLLLLAMASVASVIVELFAWSHRPALNPSDFALAAALVLGWFAAIYTVSMVRFGAPRSFAGACRFGLTSIAVILPILGSIGLLILAARSGAYGLAFGVVLLMLAASVLTGLLPGWPILQGAGQGPTSPLAAFRATKGFRWPLVVGSLAVGGIHRATFDLPRSGDWIQAVAAAMANGVIALIGVVAALSIALAAARLMQSRR